MKWFSVCIVILLGVSLVIPQDCSFVNAQSDTFLKPTDKFTISTCNSTISFSVNGSYSRASLENDTWVFTNLILDNSLAREKLNLTVSAQDCNVTITSYIKANSSFANSPAISVRLRYVVAGQGNQTFNLYLNPELGSFSVVADGVFLGLYDGWTLSSDSIITITGERRNVAIYYFGVPQTYTDFLSQSFYQQHSVIFTTFMIVAVTVVLAFGLRARNRKQVSRLRIESKNTEG